MKKLFSIIVLISIYLTGSAQSLPTYIGETKTAVTIQGDGGWGFSKGYTSMGWSIGAYDDDPNNRTVKLVMCYTMKTDNGSTAVNPNSKLILKVNGEPMVLYTKEGSQYEGSTVYKSWTEPFAKFPEMHAITYIFYEVTPEQVEAINTYGVSKYRWLTVDNLYEKDGVNEKKVAKKMSATYNSIVEKQGKTSDKMNDLSDF